MKREDYWSTRRSPDAWVISQSERESSGSEEFDQKIKKRWDEERPKFEDFKADKGEKPIVSFKEYQEDMKRAERLEKQEDLGDQSGKRLEYSIMEGINSYDWLGPDCNVVPANEYDDRVNGTDMVLCFTREDGPSVKLAVDVTTSENGHRINRKLDRIKDNVKKGRLRPVKYFYFASEEGEPRGTVFIPKVVIGTNREEEEKLFEDHLKVLGNKKEEGPKMAVYALQRELLSQIQRQLITFMEKAIQGYIEKYGRGEKTIVSELRAHLETVRKVSLDEEATSDEFNGLVDFLEKNRESLLALGERGEREAGDQSFGYAGNIYKHLEVIKTVAEIDKKKSSEGVTPPSRAQNFTEKKLRIEDKEDILAS